MAGSPRSQSAQWTETAPFRRALDYDASGNLTYIGATPGPGDVTAAAWLIKKLAYDVSGNLTGVLIANGSDAFNQAWNARASLTYT